MNEYARRTAVIIGASSGIGEALARQLDHEGWRLGLMARRLDRLEAIASDPEQGLIKKLCSAIHDVGRSDRGDVVEQRVVDLSSLWQQLRDPSASPSASIHTQFLGLCCVLSLTSKMSFSRARKLLEEKSFAGMSLQ